MGADAEGQRLIREIDSAAAIHCDQSRAQRQCAERANTLVQFEPHGEAAQRVRASDQDLRVQLFNYATGRAADAFDVDGTAGDREAHRAVQRGGDGVRGLTRAMQVCRHLQIPRCVGRLPKRGEQRLQCDAGRVRRQAHGRHLLARVHGQCHGDVALGQIRHRGIEFQHAIVQKGVRVDCLIVRSSEPQRRNGQVQICIEHLQLAERDRAVREKLPGLRHSRGDRWQPACLGRAIGGRVWPQELVGVDPLGP